MRSKNIRRHPDYIGEHYTLGEGNKSVYSCHLDTGVPDPDADDSWPTLVAQIALPHAVKVDYRRIYARWLNKHCQGLYAREYDTFHFENATDAIYFKLRFVGS